MAIRYTKKQDEQEQKNTADPWHIIGMNFGQQRPLSSRPVPVVALCGGLSDVEIATYLDGNADERLTLHVLQAARQDETLRRLLTDAIAIDEDICQHYGDKAFRSLPLVALAATEPEHENMCGLCCEAFILQRRGHDCTTEQLADEARQHGWLQTDGVRIGYLGKMLEQKGLAITKDFGYTLDDLQRLISEGKDIIAVVDGGELVGDPHTERQEDKYIGEIPDHAIVVTHMDAETRTVEVYDPQSKNERDCYPWEQFVDAWEDSGRYLVIC